LRKLYNVGHKISYILYRSRLYDEISLNF
jgi:hypothetical protein